MTLLKELTEAEHANQHSRECQVCVTLTQLDQPAREALLRALGGTIGTIKLAQILTAHGYPVGRRAIQRHQREGHNAQG